MSTGNSMPPFANEGHQRWSGFETRLVRMETVQQQHGDMLERICKCVEGDGNGVPGLRMEMDRVKRSLAIAVWCVRAMGAAILGLIGEFIKRKIT